MGMNALNDPFVKNMVERLTSDPAMSKNPIAQGLLEAIKSGDQKKGEEIANNLCKTYGVTPQEACQQAMRFFTHH